MKIRLPGKRGSGRKVGVALGSGSARGWAHIGVLRCLVDSGIGIDFIAGTSIGALVGASFSLGKLDDLERFTRGLDWRQILSFLDVTFPVSGLIEGKKVSEFVRDYIQDVRLEEMPVPFRAVAACLETGREVVLEEGDLIDAIRATVSIPGIFTPARLDARLLIDGGVVNPVPVSVVREMGADYVIAVDLSHDLVGNRGDEPPREEGETENGDQDRWLEGFPMAGELRERLSLLNAESLARLKNWFKRDQTPNIFEVILESISIMQTQIAEAQLETDPPDLLIRPRMGNLGLLDFHRSREAIDEGYRRTREALSAGN
jgi:NTE family protein